MNSPCPIIVFAKAPIPGLAKTRLAKTLGPVKTAQLAARMLDDTLVRAHAAGIGPIELCCTPDDTHPQFQAARGAGIRLSLQGEGDLGQRMRLALERSLVAHSRALLIGTDAPELSAPILREAAAALADNDAVCVPAIDGGYVLIGLSRPCPQLFADVSWSTAKVMQQTRERAAAAGIFLAELPPVHDVDEVEDLERVPIEWLK
jgi:rSAM/selenodomain-associated transferase 1